jgi:hypothetical protein
MVETGINARGVVVAGAAGKLAKSTVEGLAVGPTRVWPGGVAVARSIGDFEAGERVTGRPEVRQVSYWWGGRVDGHLCQVAIRSRQSSVPGSNDQQPAVVSDT